MRIVIFSYLTFTFILSLGTSLYGQFDSTNLPLFVIDTYGSPITDEPKIAATLNIIYQENEYNHPDDTANIYHGPIGIEIRGKFSATLPQRPYGLETRDILGQNLNVPLFQMPEENDWILLANYNDKTFMRNSLAFELFRKMGHYAPRTQFCEVLVNGYYQGIYVFTEKIKRDKGRVNISTLDPDENSGGDLTGGYIIKIDYYNDFNSWISDYKAHGQDVHFVYDYPEAETITSEQAFYIKNFIDELESILYSPNTPDRQNKLWDLMDINSFADYFILGELSRNVDAYKKSAFFYKDRDSKGGQLHAGPVWDFDWAWKNINECYFGATDGSRWAYKVHSCDPWPVPPTWMERLLEDPYFSQKVSERYASLRTSVLSETYIFNYIDSVAAVLDKAQQRHFRKWQILGVNVGTPEVDDQPLTFSGEISKFKTWINKRLNWLDINIPGLVVTGIAETEIEQPISIFPNPASSLLTIKANKQIDCIEIYVADGKRVYFENELGRSMLHLDIHELKPGLYIVLSTFLDGSQWRSKFIKSE